MKRNQLFVVDDELVIQRLLRRALEAHGYEIEIYESDKGLLEAIQLKVPRLILLDISLGTKSNGIELCRRIRAQSPVPIIMLTVQDDKKSKLAALNAGADDYITKPFDSDELEARVRAVLRRSVYEAGASKDGIIRVKKMKIDFLKQRVYLDETPIHLSTKEYELLKLLASEGGKIVSFERIVKNIWGQVESKPAQANIRAQLMSLRRKLQDNPLQPQFIFNEPGIGYRFVDIPALNPSEQD